VDARPKAGHDEDGKMETRAMKLNELADRPGSRKPRQRIGRGIGSGSGKTGGRGGKGQTARSGVRIKGFEGGQMPLHRRLPKRGFTNIFRQEYAVVNLEKLAALGQTTITPQVLRQAGLVKKNLPIKVLGDGELTAALTVQAHKFSKSAQEKIAKAGGKAEVIQGS
jgi:large subunit ribosomal protein L15